MDNSTIKELLEEFPELSEDSNKLEQVIKYLEGSNPNIEAWMEFKESLRKRLDNIIELKTWKKKRFWFFAVPVFSFCLVISLVFVYYEDISKFKTPFKGIETEAPNLTDEDWIPVSKWVFNNEEALDIEKTILKSDNIWVEEEIEVDLENLKSTNFNLEIENEDSWVVLEGSSELSTDEQIWTEIKDVMNLIDDLFNWIEDEQKIKTIIEPELDIEKIESINTKEEIAEPEEASAILKGIPKWIFNIEDNANIQTIEENQVNEIKDTIPKEIKEAKAITTEIQTSFKEYCTWESGFIVNTWKWKSCRKRNNTECLESSFDWVKCEFVPF